MRNVIANVAPVKGDPLLGQSFLSKLPAWTIDNQRHALVLNDNADPVGAQQAAPARVPFASATAEAPRMILPTPGSPAPDSSLSIGVLAQRARQALVAKNYAEAMRWLRTAAAQGLASAENDVGILYHKGLGVAPDYVEAMRWYRMAAAQGDANAEANIGLLYQNGLGVARDYAEAMRWYRMAAAQGHAAAQSNIGVLYTNGWGVPQNYAEAMRWYRMAAAQGHAVAENNIGVLIAHGAGVSKDCAVAKHWLDRAAAAGYDLARNNLQSGSGGACQW